MMRVGAHIISWLFLPLLMPIYAICTAMYIPSMEGNFLQEDTLYFIPSNFKLIILGWFIVFSFCAPGLSLLMFKLSRNISSIEVENREERGLPITITAVFCVILGVLFFIKAPNGVLPSSIYALPWGGFVGIVMAGILNRRDKISLHALGAGMLQGFFMSYYMFQAEYYFEILIASTLVGGLVLSARLYLNKHTLKQVMNGYLLGFVSVFLMVIIFMQIM